MDLSKTAEQSYWRLTYDNQFDKADELFDRWESQFIESDQVLAIALLRNRYHHIAKFFFEPFVVGLGYGYYGQTMLFLARTDDETKVDWQEYPTKGSPKTFDISDIRRVLFATMMQRNFAVLDRILAELSTDWIVDDEEAMLSLEVPAEAVLWAVELGHVGVVDALLRCTFLGTDSGAMRHAIFSAIENGHFGTAETLLLDHRSQVPAQVADEIITQLKTGKDDLENNNIALQLLNKCFTKETLPDIQHMRERMNPA